MPDVVFHEQSWKTLRGDGGASARFGIKDILSLKLSHSIACAVVLSFHAMSQLDSDVAACLCDSGVPPLVRA
jgi:hypothetical protein